MKTYTSPDGRITLINADCMDIMAGMGEREYNLAVVDPPYGIGQQKQSNLNGYNGRKPLEERLQKNRLNNGGGKLKNRKLNTSNCEWDNKIPSPEYFQELIKVSKNQIIWGGNYFPLPPSRCIICWDKVQPWENFSQIELAWTSFDSPARIYKYDNRTGDKIHSCQKPVALYSWILKNYAKPNDTILDTHGGSMSIAIAVHKANTLDNMNLKLTCIELDTEYYEKAVQRFKNYINQQTINFD